MLTAIARIRARLNEQCGFGLIELMIAMSILVIGVFATFGLFQSGIVSLRRASQISTATAVAEQEMEGYRAVTYDAIALGSTAFATVDEAYLADSACATTCVTAGTAAGQSVALGGAAPLPTKTVVGADGRSYRVDTYMMWQTVAGGRNVKQITIVVRDSGTNKVWARVNSSFDQSTGL